MNLSVTIDASGLNRALALAGEFTRRTPAEACNSAGLQVAFTAQQGMPYVLPEKVDSELAATVTVTSMIGKRGKPLKGKFKKEYTASVGGSASNKRVPLAVLVVLARANPASKYNRDTNSRYALPSSLFKKGMPRADWDATMRSIIDSMIKSRHKSGSFLKAGWSGVIRTLKKVAPRRFSKDGGKPQLQGNDDLGQAIPAVNGTIFASCTIENMIGLEGRNAESFNRALLQYGSGPLQSALDREGSAQMQYYLDKSGREDLEIPFNAAAK